MPFIDYAANRPNVLPGTRHGHGARHTMSLVNSAGQRAQVDTITVTPVDDTTFTVTLGETPFTFTTGTGATAEQVAAGLATEIGNDAIQGQRLRARESSGTLVLSGISPFGPAFTTTVGANLALVSTSANPEPDTIPFGRLVVRDENNVGRLPVAADATAGVLNESLSYGIAEYEDSVDPSLSGGILGYPPLAMMGVGTGSYHVETEAQLVVGDPIFVRLEADGALTERGVFAPAAGAGLARVPRARVLEVLSPTSAIIEIN